jgi:hypothetical protein
MFIVSIAALGRGRSNYDHGLRSSSADGGHRASRHPEGYREATARALPDEQQQRVLSGVEVPHREVGSYESNSNGRFDAFSLFPALTTSRSYKDVRPCPSPRADTYPDASGKALFPMPGKSANSYVGLPTLTKRGWQNSMFASENAGGNASSSWRLQGPDTDYTS